MVFPNYQNCMSSYDEKLSDSLASLSQTRYHRGSNEGSHKTPMTITVLLYRRVWGSLNLALISQRRESLGQGIFSNLTGKLFYLGFS